MAKSKTASAQADGDGTPNKSQAIRQALNENPKAPPKRIAEIVNEKYALGVTAQYVSVIKSQDKKSKGRKPKLRIRTVGSMPTGRPRASATAPDVFDAAVELVEAAGGLDKARNALERLERLRGRL